MDWVSFQNKESSILSTTQFPQPPPPPTLAGGGVFNLENKVSPSILLIIIILAIIFFISGLLHLLVRFMIRPGSVAGRGGDRDYELDSVTALQGQLQQLFHLHDAGVDQSFIDTLPIFLYDSIVGGPPDDEKSAPFDCAVCLCEFAAADKLRLLPKCSHAFHMECIDTWLLSHSTCPLCRSSLVADFSAANHGGGNGSNNPLIPCSPIVLVLESGSERSSREIENSNTLGRTNSIGSACSLVGCQGDKESGSCRVEIPPPEAETGSGSGHDRVLRVKLGKFRNVEASGSGSGDDTVRRCYSMGSFQYVMDESSSLQAPIRFSPAAAGKKRNPATGRPAMSVCGCESAREFGQFGEGNASIVPAGNGGRESSSISKIWTRGGKKGEGKQGISETGELSSRRTAVSFRFPVSSELGFSGEQSCGSSGRELGDGKTPSFARRTLLWLAGKQNKVVHSNFTPDV
ncbi:unnamed protein product [Linum tenue]|uniref:RING-type E3 ubiquitin transferase n=1 Tax=Linum tenue TaxID=586396 RepID=A0AAV0KZW2_9ROSI|nr:unnamed protein product [Linum tenue]